MDTMQPNGQIDVTPDPLLERAARHGFALAQFATSTGQTAWEWRRGDEPRPQFATERVARQWMSEWLARQIRATFNRGRMSAQRR